ncbi:type IA DNA topoisomerase [Winogradskyella sp. SYSU M77433]|uniref:type IA DNA topoisomerase n=1 Tax=Winogradskyella sp. SYSU M77433 TaxID=3042722 RepID=UPI0024804CA0|nr:type IA DNA topoisomerase [Winogradskyella sp. SYSU M77433]MDH7913898.1 DNA topoisomerase 3 [Winogradskyella sp. SYSU M77433]
MKVCIAEKPSVAREIASVLGATTKRDGYFEGNGYAVTYTFGHLCTLCEPSDYKPYWKSWDLNNLPMLPDKFKVKVANNDGIKKQFKIVKSLFDKADVVINCGDAGQEGELIQRWVINEAKYKGKVERLWISSLTTEAIKEGFDNLKPSENYDNLYYAGFSRSIGDWLLGINATRLYTVKHGGYKQVLSVGRVQTPTLAMLVNRYKEIENFVPQPYWELQTMYRDTLFSYEEGRFLKMEDGEKLATKVKEHEFEIESITKKKGTEYAPKLFDLTGLQVYCNNKFGFSADETLKIAQRLYEKKVVTYPRVDTTFLPNDVYPKVKNILSKLTDYSELTTSILNKKIKKSSRVFNDKKVTDHHAIIPTGIQTHLQPAEQQVYDIITRRFIAVFYDDCKVSNTTVIGKAADVNFKTTGKEILSKGWRVVFESDSSKNKGESILPSFVKGEKGPHEPSFLEKQTKPPNQYTEASLLRAMETAGKQVDDDELRDLMKENGIGRPSTRANIIETLFKRKYIKRNKKQILPTVTGIQLIDTIQNELLKSAELTGTWEKQLKDIEKGKISANAFIKGMKRMVDALVYEVRSEKVETRISAVNNKPTSSPKAKKKSKSKSLVGSDCPKCKNGQLLKGKSAYGCSLYGKSCDFTLPFSFADKKISENQYKRLLSKGSTVNLKGFNVQGNSIEGLLRFDDNFKLKLEPKQTAKNLSVNVGDTCPKCKTGKILKGKTAFGCSNYKSGCDFRVNL